MTRMEMRVHLVGQIVNGVLSSDQTNLRDVQEDVIARGSVRLADRLLAELDKGTNHGR